MQLLVNLLIAIPWSAVLLLSWAVNKWQMLWRPLGGALWCAASVGHAPSCPAAAGGAEQAHAAACACAPARVQRLAPDAAAAPRRRWSVDQMDQRAPGAVDWMLWAQGLVSLALHIVTVGVNLGVIWVCARARARARQAAAPATLCNTRTFMI